jgi:dTDP-4-amino-4,6-dideoxygalactose transaminase
MHGMTLPVPDCLFPDFPAADRLYLQNGIAEAVRRVLERGQYVLGAEVNGFEAEFAAFLGVGHAIGVASGTDAIELMLRALEIGRGAVVALPALAPSACAAAVRRAGAEVVLVDVDETHLTLSPQALETVLRSHKVRAVLAVHLYGHPVAWDELSAVCDAHGVLLLEDCAQAHGTTYRDRKAGTLGRAAAWSFYPTKNLGALGDAGAITTSDEALAQRLRQMREYGWVKRQISDFDGINSRLDELQAAVLRVKLPALAASLAARRLRVARYASRVSSLVSAHTAGHAFHQLVLRHAHRDALQAHLKQRGIPSAVHYPAALHQQPAFACAGSFPNAERAVREVLSLPVHPHVPLDAVDVVCAALEAFSS